VVRADTSGDGELELLGLGQALSGQVTGVEAGRAVRSGCRIIREGSLTGW
jgi:hypothetical protein